MSTQDVYAPLMRQVFHLGGGVELFWIGDDRRDIPCSRCGKPSNTCLGAFEDELGLFGANNPFAEWDEEFDAEPPQIKNPKYPMCHNCAQNHIDKAMGR